MKTIHVAQVRRFHRLVTKRAGALEDHFLGRDRPLGESRVLYEVGPSGADLRELRARLELDSGYLSRLVQSLAGKGLLVLRPGEDERVRRAELTAAGRAELEEMNRRSDDAARAILAPLSAEQRERLVKAMAEVQHLLRASGVVIERVDPRTGPARWCVTQYFDELDRRLERGFDPAQSIPADDDEMLPPRGAFVLATIAAEPVACGAVKAVAPGVGSLKRMWVAESARGLGLGRRILAALEQEARLLGLGTVRLETNRALVEAIRLYRTAGYVEVPAFNDDPYADHWFEKHLESREVGPPR